MKSKILFIALSVCAIKLDAQDLSFGLRTGLNFSYQTLSDNFKQTVRVGIPFGAYCNWMISNKIGIQSELLYNSLGTKYNGVPGLRPEIVYRFNYLSLPISFKYKISGNVHVFAGPQVGYLLMINTSPATNLKTDYYTSFDFGGVIGVGYDLNRFNIGIRYYEGLINVNKLLLNGSGSGAASVKNNAFQFLVGYRLWTIKRK